MNLNFNDNQIDKKALEAKNKTNLVKQSFEAEKSSKKVRKKEKQKGRQKWRKRPNPTTRANATSNIATDSQRQKIKKKAQNIFKIIYYNCNNKGHYASNCTKPKN